MREFDTGATRDDDEGKLDYEGFLSPVALKRYAEYMHEHRKQADGKMRASDNWQRGIPIIQYMKSLVRHTIDLWKLQRWISQIEDFGPKAVTTDEDKERENLLCAILFNTFGMLHEITESSPGAELEEPAPYPLAGKSDDPFE